MNRVMVSASDLLNYTLSFHSTMNCFMRISTELSSNYSLFFANHLANISCLQWHPVYVTYTYISCNLTTWLSNKPITHILIDIWQVNWSMDKNYFYFIEFEWSVCMCVWKAVRDGYPQRNEMFIEFEDEQALL